MLSKHHHTWLKQIFIPNVSTQLVAPFKTLSRVLFSEPMFTTLSTLEKCHTTSLTATTIDLQLLINLSWVLNATRNNSHTPN